MNTTAAVCLIVKNEVEDIAEWVDHYARIGFCKIVIYDNNSCDGTLDILRFLSKTYPITIYHWDPPISHLNGGTRQIAAYMDACRRLAHEVDWILFIDADEFLLPPTMDAKVGELLKRHEKHDAFVINWKIFGSQEIEETAGQLIMGAFDRRAPIHFGPNQHVKMFCRPEMVKEVINPHYAETGSPTYDVFGTMIPWGLVPGIVDPGTIVEGDWQVYHYMIRSREHWRRRIARRQVNDLARDLATFIENDRNDVIDRKGVKWAALVRDSLLKIGIVRTVGPISLATLAMREAIADERRRFSGQYASASSLPEPGLSIPEGQLSELEQAQI